MDLSSEQIDKIQQRQQIFLVMLLVLHLPLQLIQQILLNQDPFLFGPENN